MPCKDVTELIRVELDASDRLASYRFVKRTCGQGVGADSLLLDELRGQPIDAIMAVDLERFVESHPVEESIEEFLMLKHLVAVQSALAVLTGQADGGPGEICAAAEVAYEDGMTVMDARISVDLVTERIKSCGGCKGCGKTKSVREVVTFN